MKKNTCPFLDSQKRCTHKNPLVKSEKSFKLPDCPFFNPLKCELHNLWLKEQKSFRMATNEDTTLIKGWVKQLKDRYKKRNSNSPKLNAICETAVKKINFSLFVI